MFACSIRLFLALAFLLPLELDSGLITVEPSVDIASVEQRVESASPVSLEAPFEGAAFIEEERKEKFRRLFYLTSVTAHSLHPLPYIRFALEATYDQARLSDWALWLGRAPPSFA